MKGVRQALKELEAEDRKERKEALKEREAEDIKERNLV